jgi:hypothetical protein
MSKCYDCAYYRDAPPGWDDCNGDYCYFNNSNFEAFHFQDCEHFVCETSLEGRIIILERKMHTVILKLV